MKLHKIDEKWYRLELDSGAEIALDDDDVLNLHLQIHNLFKQPTPVDPKFYGEIYDL